YLDGFHLTVGRDGAPGDKLGLEDGVPDETLQSFRQIGALAASLQVRISHHPDGVVFKLLPWDRRPRARHSGLGFVLRSGLWQPFIASSHQLASNSVDCAAG